MCKTPFVLEYSTALSKGGYDIFLRTTGIYVAVLGLTLADGTIKGWWFHDDDERKAKHEAKKKTNREWREEIFGARGVSTVGKPEKALGAALNDFPCGGDAAASAWVAATRSARQYNAAGSTYVSSIGSSAASSVWPFLPRPRVGEG